MSMDVSVPVNTSFKDRVIFHCTCGHVGHFCLLTFASSAARNIHVQVFDWTQTFIILDMFTAMEFLGHVTILFNFPKNDCTVFHNGYTFFFRIPTISVRSFQFLYILISLFSIKIFIATLVSVLNAFYVLFLIFWTYVISLLNYLY